MSSTVGAELPARCGLLSSPATALRGLQDRLRRLGDACERRRVRAKPMLADPLVRTLEAQRGQASATGLEPAARALQDRRDALL